ncbi:hypothetical protein ARMSODRAFT_962167 [Armillaria solidipes]|uniref:eIF3a PCI domain-containing protein n=1 Tax=Armillaria solidipes TaxID=1076256 RepID=A0A2H3BKG9_9AGAR|nr:hypothetical protein ARMSODRAFT_962167 [Armillaria solidipes]
MLEVKYQQISLKSGLQHQCKVDFRRLCETLRLHLPNVAKYSQQPHSINLSDSDTLQHRNLLTMVKKVLRPAMMSNYYEKLTKNLFVSGMPSTIVAWARYYALLSMSNRR